MEDNSREYQIKQGEFEYTLYTSIIGNAIRLLVKKSNGEKLFRDFTVEQFQSFNYNFSMVQSVTQAIEFIDDVLNNHKVGILEENNGIVIIFYIITNGMIDQIDIPLDNSGNGFINENVDMQEIDVGGVGESLPTITKVEEEADYQIKDTQNVQIEYLQPQYLPTKYINSEETDINVQSQVNTTNVEQELRPSLKILPAQTNTKILPPIGGDDFDPNQLDYLVNQNNQNVDLDINLENLNVGGDINTEELNSLGSEVKIKNVGAKEEAAKKEMDNLKKENELYKTQIEEYKGLKDKMVELKSLKDKLAELLPLKSQLEELNKIKEEVDKMKDQYEEYKEKAAEAEKLKLQIQEYEKEIKELRTSTPPIQKEEKNIKCEEEKKVENKIENKLESKKITFEQKQEKLEAKGTIIHNPKELEMLTRKINKNNKKIILNLLYKATADSDKAEAFHSKCDEAQSSIVLIETDKGKRFGGFTTCSWSGDYEEKMDENAFIFSLDKMKIYENIPKEEAIGCYPNYGPIFLGCQIKIYDNAFTKGGSTYERQLNYNTDEDYELTDGDKTFNIKDIEVYEVITQ
jgi:hypothetical protein